MTEIIELIKSKYSKVESLNAEETIYKAEATYNGNVVYKVMYFDISQQIPTSTSDIEEYHHKHIAPSYYETPGSIQWNNYIYFIFDRDEKPTNTYLLEKNKDYARKIVLTKRAFTTFLDNDINALYQQQTEPVADLIGEWSNELGRNQLEFISDKRTYKTNFIETLLTKNIQEETNKVLINEAIEAPVDINFPEGEDTFIQTINLADYRDYPSVRNFDFNRVNLIHGVNGAGKTSLLEAIEIVTCGGKTYRSKGEVEPNIDDLILGFSTGGVSVSRNTNIYKERAKQWYGSTNDRGNRLFENFNKFNFYHAEAANDISKDGNINNIIKNIVLGKDIAWYEERISEATRLFQKEKERLENRKKPELKAKQTSLKTKIDNVKKQKVGLKSTFMNFIAILNSLHWKKDLPVEDKVPEELFLDIANLQSTFDSIYKLSESTKITDLSKVDTLSTSLETNNKMLIDTVKSITNIKENKKKYISKIETISLKISNLQKISEWLNLENISELSGLENKLSKCKKENITLENAFQSNSLNEQFKDYQEVNVNIIELRNELQNIIQKQKEDNKILANKLIEEEQKTGDLNTYKSNLQDYALKVLTVSTDKSICPVCTTKFKSDELVNLIGNITEKIEGIDIIQKYKKEISDLEKKINDNYKELKIIIDLILLGNKLFGEDKITLMTVQSIIENIDREKEKLLFNKAQIDKLEQLKEYFSLKGITEREYTKFIALYETKYNDYGLLSQASLEKIKNKYIQELDSESESIKKFDEELKVLGLVIKRIKDKWDIFIDNYQDLLKYYSKLLHEVQQLKKYKEIMLTYITPRENTVEFLFQNASILFSVSKQYSELLIQNEKGSIVVLELENNEKDISAELKSLSDNLTKLNSTLAVLENLEKVDVRLNHFFEENKENILRAFISIHAPEEFDDLEFNANEGIKLKRIGTNQYETVLKISTGQKSALTLAIFLAMNRNAKNAPKYILFDDPVSNTDDINILAFLDYLGDIAISGERQIFFATANSKVANLFRKKFDFLGDDFTYSLLER